MSQYDNFAGKNRKKYNSETTWGNVDTCAAVMLTFLESSQLFCLKKKKKKGSIEASLDIVQPRSFHDPLNNSTQCSMRAFGFLMM